MSYKALYRKYRPTKFEDVVGQEYIIKALKNSIKNNKIAHAYLFTGTRGTGKTTIAKIFSKCINCLSDNEIPCEKCSSCISSNENSNPDIIEIDAASNNSVDNIREIIERVKYAPTSSKYKVYIIDEVHMLSKGAFNALLKTLEEPPSYVVFILATTEPHKVIETIISRCQRYDFLRVDKQSIVKRISDVAQMENIKISEEAKQLIAYLAEGGMRDALSILDQCISYSDDEIQVQDIKELYGLTTIKDKINLIQNIEKIKSKEVLQNLKELNLRGIDFKKLTTEIINILKETILYKYTKDSEILELLEIEDVKVISDMYDINDLLKMIDILMQTLESYVNSSDIFSYFEVACLKLMNIKQTKTTDNQKNNEIKYDIKEENNEISNIKHEEIEQTKNIDLDNDFIISLLVQCDKNSKIEDINKFENLSKYRYDINTGKYSTLLIGTSIIASGKDCLIITSNHESIVNNINEENMNKGIYLFIKDKLNIDKMVYAISDKQYKEVLNIFKEKSINKTLPKPYQIQRYKQEEKEIKDEDMERVLSIFKDNVEIIEEE